MKNRTSLTYVGTFPILAFLAASAFFSAAAQEKVTSSPEKRASSQKKAPVIFKIPNGYMPADFPEHKVGKLLLDAKRPAGMFIVYPNDSESPEALSNQLKSIVAGMFFHNEKSDHPWAVASLPAHQGVDGESAMLAVASDDKMEVQLASYTGRFGATEVIYGYYAMRHKSGKSKDDGRFLDNTGGGVEDFDKFWKSIRPSK